MSKKFSPLVVLVYFITIGFAFGQQRKLLGRIVDKETQKPIKEASIAVEGADKSAFSNHLGYFEIVVDSTAKAFIISHDGYTPVRASIPIEDKFKIALDKAPPAVENNPIPLDAFYRHLQANCKYPKEARTLQIQGVTLLSFKVDTSGVVRDPKVIAGLHASTDQEVYRMIASLPATQGRELTVATNYKAFLLPIYFGLGERYVPQSQPAPPAVDVFLLNPLHVVAIGIDQPDGSFYVDMNSESYWNVDKALANRTKAKKLLLTKQGLSEFPKAIYDLPRLEHLDLDENDIRSLPYDIDKLANLKGLFLFRNQLTDLPASFANLKGLKTLGLASNHFETFPSSITALAKLEILDLSGNQLEQLPAAIGSMANLEELALNGNRIKTLPQEIYQLKKLRKLHLKGNPIAPDELVRIRSTLKKTEVIY